MCLQELKATLSVAGNPARSLRGGVAGQQRWNGVAVLAENLASIFECTPRLRLRPTRRVIGRRYSGSVRRIVRYRRNAISTFRHFTALRTAIIWSRRSINPRRCCILTTRTSTRQRFANDTRYSNTANLRDGQSPCARVGTAKISNLKTPGAKYRSDTASAPAKWDRDDNAPAIRTTRRRNARQ